MKNLKEMQSAMYNQRSQHNRDKLDKFLDQKFQIDHSVDNRYKVYERKKANNEQQIEANRQKLRLEKLKRDEVWNLRRLDQIDNLNDIKLNQEQEKQRILFKQHFMNMQSHTVKEKSKQNEDSRFRMTEEYQSYMSQKRSNKPYEEMRHKYL